MLQNEVISYNSAFLHSRQITHKNTEVKKKILTFCIIGITWCSKECAKYFYPRGEECA